MNIKDVKHAVAVQVKENHLNLSWDGDNSVYVVEKWLPLLPLRPEVRQVLRWSYGYDGSDRSYEKESDGSTGVRDVFLKGKIKEPYGVGHDMICAWHREGRTDPTGRTWKWTEGIAWYRAGLQDFGYPVRAWERPVGLYAVSWWFWFVRPGVVKEQT